MMSSLNHHRWLALSAAWAVSLLMLAGLLWGLGASRVLPAQAQVGIPIREIQGLGHISLYSGTLVSEVSGIVTAVRADGFYMQDPVPDAATATSEGIFVLTVQTPTVLVGDSVIVSGTVREARPGGNSGFNNLTITELASPNLEYHATSNGNPLPAPVVIGIGGRVPPPVVIDDDAMGDVETSGTFDPDTDGIDFYESLEGMLVLVNNAVVVDPTDLDGQAVVLADDGAATARTTRGGALVSSTDFNPERLFLDDQFVTLPQLRVGDSLPGPITAVVGYSQGNFKLELLQPIAFTAGNLVSETMAAPSGDQVSLAHLNTDNLDPTDPVTKFEALANVIVARLEEPDIVALESVQDNNGEVDDGEVAASLTYSTLISHIQTAGGPVYEFRDISPVDDQDGGQIGGNARLGFLFRPDRVTFVDRPGGTATTAVTAVSGPSGPQLSFSPGRVDPNNPAFAGSRKSLAAEFVFNDHTLFVIANHFIGRNDDQPLFGRFQPPASPTEITRTLQAGPVNGLVDSILTLDYVANVVVLGDFNDHEFSTTLLTLKSNDLTNLMETLPTGERYTQVFEGNSQALDHLLVSANLMLGAAPVYDVVHVGAEFPQAVQTSDHDPQVARFDLPPPSPFSGSMKLVNASEVNAGDPLTYTLVISNSDPGPLPFVITDVLNANLELISAPGMTVNGQTLTASGAVAGLGQQTFTIVVRTKPSAGGQLVNTATLTGDGGMHVLISPPVTVHAKLYLPSLLRS
jgi:hypothetical protein